MGSNKKIEFQMFLFYMESYCYVCVKIVPLARLLNMYMCQNCKVSLQVLGVGVGAIGDTAVLDGELSLHLGSQGRHEVEVDTFLIMDLGRLGNVFHGPSESQSGRICG